MEPFIQAAAEINVEEIMAAIRKKIQDKKDSGLLKQSEIDEIAEMELQPLPDFQEIPNIYEPILYPDCAENQVPPVSGEEAIQENGLAKGILKKVRSLLFPLIRFMSRPLFMELRTSIVETQNHSIEIQNQLLRHLPIVRQSSEYIRLLHNVMHNMIVEVSKLKTEEELLKTKIKILEDKIEFLENRERALENKLQS